MSTSTTPTFSQLYGAEPTTREGEFRIHGCTVVVTKDAGLWHLSISHPSRLPKYEEIKEARYKLLPDVHYAAQIFPPEDEFVNVHLYCIHLWELGKDETYSDDRRESES